MVKMKFYGVQGGFTKTALLGGNSQIAGQSPITPSESATASFDSLMDVKSAFVTFDKSNKIKYCALLVFCGVTAVADAT